MGGGEGGWREGGEREERQCTVCESTQALWVHTKRLWKGYTWHSRSCQLNPSAQCCRGRALCVSQPGICRYIQKVFEWGGTRGIVGHASLIRQPSAVEAECCV